MLADTHPHCSHHFHFLPLKIFWEWVAQLNNFECHLHPSHPASGSGISILCGLKVEEQKGDRRGPDSSTTDYFQTLSNWMFSVLKFWLKCVMGILWEPGVWLPFCTWMYIWMICVLGRKAGLWRAHPAAAVGCPQWTSFLSIGLLLWQQLMGSSMGS